MPAYVVIGGQWGDEGKGKIVDFLANNIQVFEKGKKNAPRPADMVVRYNGGNNAGHTVWNPFGEFKLHLVPGGIFIPTCTSIIASEAKVEPRSFVEELLTIQKECKVGIEDLMARLRISEKAHLVFPWHIVEDKMQEEMRRGSAIGTTHRGMGPVTVDKYARIGLRVGDLLDPSGFSRKFRDTWNNWKRALFDSFYRYHAPKAVAEGVFSQLGDPTAVLKSMFEFGKEFRQCFADTEKMLEEASDQGKHILFEGAQGYLLDIDHGTYPHVTSSKCGVAAAFDCGVPPREFREIIGVFKAYMTRVGGGQFPSEADEEDAQRIRKIANEYGTVTRRPRRIGWFDFSAGRYTADRNYLTKIAVTRLDTLDNFSEFQVSVAYDCAHEERGREKAFPSPTHIYCNDFSHVIKNGGVKGIFEKREGWGPGHLTKQKVAGCSSWEELPFAVKTYCKEIEEKVGRPIFLISTGARRHETIVMKE